MTREQLEKLADLTEGDIYEAALANPKIAAAVAAKDNRVILQEKIYSDKIARKRMQEDSKRLFPNASIPELDIPELIRSELKSDLDEIKALKAQLETDVKSRRHDAFRAKLREAGADAEDLDAVETFMVDNEIGPKSVSVAVEKFYQAKEIAEPRGMGLSPEMPLDSKDEHMKALLATGPGEDLDRVNEPWVEAVFQDMFGAKPGRR